MGGKARRGKARGHGATTLLHLMAGQRVDRRQAHVRAVDRIAEGLAQQLGAKRFRDLRQAEAMAVFHCAGMHAIAASYLAEWVRTGNLDLYERYAAAVGNVRRLLASLGLQAADVEEASDLERALRQSARVPHTVGPGEAQTQEEGEG